jgi:hypothetical protein
MKHSPFLLLVFLCNLLIACGPSTIPNDKQTFVGRWYSHSGFSIDININGTATLVQNVSPTDQDYAKLCIKVGPPIIKDISVEFEGDSLLRVVKRMAYAKEYMIDRSPYQDNNQMKLVLNGVTLIRQ